MAARSRNTLRSSLAAPCILTAATVLLFVLGPGSMNVPPMDDTYIHLVYGGSLISGAPLQFNASEPSSGFTSPLWLLPSALSSLAGRSAAPLVLMGFSLVAACAALLMTAPATALLLMLAGPFFFHSASGMETALSCLVVAAAWKWIEKGGSMASGSLVLAAAFLTRPDLSVLMVPMIAAMDERRPARLVLLAAPTVLLGLLWMLWNFHSMGLPLPSTFYAKQSLSWFTMASAGLPGLLRGLMLTSPLLLFAAAVSVISDLRSCGRKRMKTALALMPVILFTAAVALQPNSFFQMRYQVPAVTAAVLAAGRWLQGLGGRRRLNTLILGLSMVPGLLVFAGRRAGASTDVLHIDVIPAQYLARIADPGETVAAADIGAVKWITGLEVLDLDGLVTAERLPGPERAGWSWIADRADYLLAFPCQYSELIEEAGGTLRFLDGFRSPAGVICGEDSVGLWKVDQLDRTSLSGLF